MKTRRICYLLCLTVLLMTLCAACTGGGESGREETGAGTSLVRLQIGGGMRQQLGDAAAPLSHPITRQRIAAIPPDVAAITLQVSVDGVDIPGSPMSISLTGGTSSVTIGSNTAHLFSIKALNQRGEAIFQGQETVNLPPGAVADVSIELEAIVLPTRPVASQPIDAATGGVITVGDTMSPVQGLRLTIPPGALSQDTTITVAEVYNPKDVPVLITQAGVFIDLGPDGTTFAQPVTVAYPYDASLVQDLGLDEANLRLLRFDPQVNEYVVLPGQVVDTEANIIRAGTTSFSLFVPAVVPAVFPSPTISTIDPISGPTSGGTPITMTGLDFVAPATVMIGGSLATNVIVDSATQISAVTPAGSPGPAAVVVTNPDGQSDTLPGGFTYAGAQTVSIGSPPSPIASGQLFTVPVILNTAGANIVSYLLELTFDPAVVVVTDIAGGSALFEAPAIDPTTFSSGSVRFAANNPTFAPTNGSVSVANITFQAVGNAGSTAGLTLAFPPTPGGFGALVNAQFATINDFTFVPGSITIQ